jgi:hypothetical protein
MHKQNAIHVDPGKILDQGKKKRAVKAKQMVCTLTLPPADIQLTNRTNSLNSLY